MSDFYNLLLRYYQISDEKLKDRNKKVTISDLNRPYNLEKFLLVTSRIKKAIDDKEKIVIYGDYDFDGISSTAIIKRMFDKLSYQVGFFIPSRYKEGYGLKKERVDQFIIKGYNLIITVDNGASCNELISYCKSKNVDVVVIDHHVIQEEVKTPYLFHQNDSGFLDYNCSAASLAYFISSYILQEDDLYNITLAGLAVFSDIMELKGNNLIFAKLALENINNNTFSNLEAFIYPKKKPYSYDDLSFNIISSINAVGRVCKDSISTINACRYLLNPDIDDKIKNYFKTIVKANDEKKKIVSNFTIDSEINNEYIYCLTTSSFSGLTGLYANKILKKYNKPTAVFAIDEKNNEMLVGSIRVNNSYSLLNYLNNPKKYFISSGGHKKAMGITINKKDYYQFITDFMLLISSQVKEEEKSITITLDELTLSNYKVYKLFEPFGEGFNKPIFDVIVKGSDIKKISDKYTCCFSSNNEGKIAYFSSIKEEILKESYYVFKGELNLEKFNNQEHFTLYASEYKKESD